MYHNLPFPCRSPMHLNLLSIDKSPLYNYIVPLEITNQTYCPDMS